MVLGLVNFNKTSLAKDEEERRKNKLEKVFKDSDERPCFFIDIYKRASHAPIQASKRDMRAAAQAALKPAIVCVTQRKPPKEEHAVWAPDATVYYLRAAGPTDAEPRVHKDWPMRSLVRLECVKLPSSDPAPFLIELTFQGAGVSGGDTSTIFASADEHVQIHLACYLHFYCQEYEKRPVPIFGLAPDVQEAWIEQHRPLIEASGNLEAKVDLEIRKETGGVLMGQREEADLEELSKSYAVDTADMDSLAEMAQRELQALEFANVHSILEGNDQVAGLLQRMAMTFGSLDDLESWLSVFNDKLVHMREDIHAIEETNLRLERQAQNHQRLVDLLKGLMGQIQVSEESEEALLEGDIDEPGPELEGVVRGVRELHEALSRIDPHRARRAKKVFETGAGESEDDSDDDVSLVGSEDEEEGGEGEGEREERKESPAPPPGALPSVPKEILGLEAVREMRQELEDLEEHFLERFSDSILDLIKSECQATARAAQRGEGVPDLTELHEALKPYRALFEAVRALSPKTWHTVAISYGKLVGGMLRTCMKMACLKQTGGQDLSTFFARVAKGGRAPPDARTGRPPLPSSAASVVSAGAYSARTKFSVGSGVTFSSFITDAEHLPPLEEGAAEERPDRLILTMVEPFVPILMDEVLFLADAMLMSKGPIPKNFDPAEHEIPLTAAGERAVEALLKGIADDWMTVAAGVIKAKKILTLSALAVTYFWREVCVRNVGAGPHVKPALDELAEYFESTLTADIQERVATITKFHAPAKGTSTGLKATHVLPFTARLGPFVAATEQMMAELRRNCKAWAKELRKKRQAEQGARLRSLQAEERSRQKQEAERERREEAGGARQRHSSRPPRRVSYVNSEDEDERGGRSDGEDSLGRPHLSDGSLSPPGSDRDDDEDASSLGRGLSDDEEDEGEAFDADAAPSEPPIIFEVAANAEFVSDLQSKTAFGRGALWTPNMVRTVSALVGEEYGCTLEWTLINPEGTSTSSGPNLSRENSGGAAGKGPGRTASLPLAKNRTTSLGVTARLGGEEEGPGNPFEGLERSVVQAVRRVVSGVHVKLTYAVLGTVEKVAVTDTKREDRLRLENYGLMAEQLGVFAPSVPYLASVLESVGRAADLAMGRYVRGLLKKGGLWELLEMVTWIDLLKDDLGPQEVRYQLNFSLPEVRKVIKTAMTGVEKRLREVQQKVQEHVGSNPALVQRVWAAFSDALVSTYERLAFQLDECYGEKFIQPPVADLEALLQGMMQQISVGR